MAFLPALLVLCLDGMGISLIKAWTGGSGLWMLAWIGFLLLTTFAGGLFLLELRQGRHKLLFGVLLAVVNSAWTLSMLLRRDAGDPLQMGYLAVASVLAGLGALVTLHALAMRSRR